MDFRQYYFNEHANCRCAWLPIIPELFELKRPRLYFIEGIPGMVTWRWLMECTRILWKAS